LDDDDDDDGSCRFFFSGSTPSWPLSFPCQQQSRPHAFDTTFLSRNHKGVWKVRCSTHFVIRHTRVMADLPPPPSIYVYLGFFSFTILYIHIHDYYYYFNELHFKESLNDRYTVYICVRRTSYLYGNKSKQIKYALVDLV